MENHEIESLKKENARLEQENKKLKKLVRNKALHVNEFVEMIAKMDDLLVQKRDQISALEKKLENAILVSKAENNIKQSEMSVKLEDFSNDIDSITETQTHLDGKGFTEEEWTKPLLVEDTDGYYLCPFSDTLFCTYKSRKKYNMYMHNFIHTGEKPYKCNYCEYRATTGSAAKIHVNLHRMINHQDSEVYSCSICDRKFAQSTLLRRHAKIEHDGHGWQSLKRKAENSIKHSRSEMSIKLEDFSIDIDSLPIEVIGTETIKELGYTEEKWTKPYLEQDENGYYLCPNSETLLCSYKSRKKYNMYMHNFVHTGEKPFKCNHCEYRSTTGSHAKVHARSHGMLDSEMYSCSICDRKFTQSTLLRRHAKIEHDGHGWQSLKRKRKT